MVELFVADIRQIAPRAEALVRLLDAERQARVRAFGGSAEALRSLAAGLLLHHVFGEESRGGRYELGGRGKPSLRSAKPFNLSHSGDYAVLAVSCNSVGVDLERIRPIDWERISARFFHPSEQAYLSQSADPRTAFFWIWTLKESYLKAEGLGFSVSPARFCILPEGETDARMSGQTGYGFRRFPVIDGYCLSLCCVEREIASEVRLLSF